MAVYKTEDYRCKNCGYFFIDDAVSFIRFPSDNLKDKILSRDIFNHKCPKCNLDNYIPSSFLYVDDNNKIVIISALYSEAIVDRIDIKEEFPNYQIYISETPSITIDIINAIDNKLDPLVLEYMKYHITRIINKKEKYYHVIDSYIEYKDEVEFGMVAIVSDYYGNFDKIDVSIKDNMYNDFSIKIEKFKSGIDSSIISPIYINKLYVLEKNKEIEEAKKRIIKLAICKNEDDHTILVIANNNYNPGDKVEIKYLDSIESCTIENIITMTDYEYYDILERLPYVE